MWECLRLFETDVGTACAYLRQMLGEVAPISDRCGDRLRLFEKDVGRGCTYLRKMLERLRLLEADVGQFAPI